MIEDTTPTPNPDQDLVPEITAEIKCYDCNGDLKEHIKVRQDGTEETIYKRRV